MLFLAFPMDYTINGMYIHNGNQYCPIAIMLRRDCSYTMQLSTTRRTCQERNEGDQWIFNCQYGTDSHQNFEIMPARCIINRRYFLVRIITCLPLYSARANEIQRINKRFARTSSMSYYVPTMTNQIKKHGNAINKLCPEDEIQRSIIRYQMTMM